MLTTLRETIQKYTLYNNKVYEILFLVSWEQYHLYELNKLFLSKVVLKPVCIFQVKKGVDSKQYKMKCVIKFFHGRL